VHCPINNNLYPSEKSKSRSGVLILITKRQKSKEIIFCFTLWHSKIFYYHFPYLCIFTS